MQPSVQRLHDTTKPGSEWFIERYSVSVNPMDALRCTRSRMHSSSANLLPLAASAQKDYFRDRRADLSGSPWRCPAVPAAVHTDRRHPVSTKTAVFFIRRSTRSCCQTAYYWTSRLPCRQRSHMERLSYHKLFLCVTDSKNVRVF